MLQVYKFGGASIAGPERMQQLLPIVKEANSKLIIIISAIGKTTNALEEVAKFASLEEKEQALAAIQKLESFHQDYTQALLRDNETLCTETLQKLQVHFTELKWAIDDGGVQSKDYVYDQIVCIGELLSSTIFSAYLEHTGLKSVWVDSRDVIKTDNIFKEPNVDIETSRQLSQQKIAPLFNEFDIIVAQGFIGSTSDNESTTLGREGSDYSAALFAAFNDADSVSIWKDVEGLLNADPRLFPNTVRIEEITYHEVIEMAYYGAQVIHPKTIKPLQNAGIPLLVKCFLDRTLKGTVIKSQTDTFIYPPLIILKKNQNLLQITSKDFSFITEDNLSNLYNIFHAAHVKINLIQNEAISLVVCVDNQEDKLKSLISELESDYKVLRNADVQLLTIRHYTPTILEEVTKGRTMLLEQRTRNTVQVVVK